MSNTPHTLGDEFPEQIDVIHALKARNPEFAHVLTEYDDGQAQPQCSTYSCQPLDGSVCNKPTRNEDVSHPEGTLIQAMSSPEQLSSMLGRYAR